MITLFIFYVSCPPLSVFPALVVCASTHFICSGGFEYFLGIIVPSATRADVVVKSNAIAMRPEIPTLHPFLGLTVPGHGLV